MREPELDPRQKRRLLAYSRDAVSHGFQNVEFDPVWVLIQDLGASGTMGGALRNCAQDIEKKTPIPEGHGYNIERKGDVVTLKVYGRDDESEGGGISSSSYVFDIAKGCSMVGQHHVSSKSETHWELDYEEHNGVFVPSEIRRVHRDASMGLHHHIVFTTEMVNKPVSESEFSYEALGLRPGDYIIDHVKGGLGYQWRPDMGIDKPFQTPDADVGTLDTKGSSQPGKNEIETRKKQETEAVPVPAEEVVATAPPQQKNRTVTAYWLGLLGILVIIVVGILLLRRKVRPTKEAK